MSTIPLDSAYCVLLVTVEALVASDITDALSAQLHVPVEAATLDALESVGERLMTIARTLCVPIVVVPLTMPATRLRHLQAIVDGASERGLGIAIRLSAMPASAETLAGIAACVEATLPALDAPRPPMPHLHGVTLPPRYTGDISVSAAPMASADLVYDTDGNVAWDAIWGDFCDLALAGGPPHRGTLLEPAPLDAIQANPERYAVVLAELERGIRLVTGLATVRGASGWVGIQCASEEMALWLLRAIIVENVSVRREGMVLWLPAGAHFRLEYEIKNVITVIAKTHHYWLEHITL